MDNAYLRRFNDAWEKLIGLGVPNEEGHELLVQAREEQIERDSEMARRMVFVGGEKVAVIYAFSDGEIEIRRPVTDLGDLVMGERI